MSIRLCDLLSFIPEARCDKRFDGFCIRHISCDSREQQPDGLFVALAGFKFNGADFIRDAIANGAVAIAKTDGARQSGQYHIPQNIAVIEVTDTKIFLRQAAEHFYGNPSSKVRVIGVTGTNGKTTITYLLESILHADKKKCGVIGTVNCRIGQQVFPSKNTTPGYLESQRYLAQLAAMNAPFCVMEVSSHALQQGRVDGIDFAAAVFTNLTQDHLDYHTGMEQYFQAKALLFTRLKEGAKVVINTDDEYGRRLVKISRGNVLTYGIDAPSSVMAEHMDYRLNGMTFEIIFPDGVCKINTRLTGKHNVYNILSAAVCAYSLGIALPVIEKGLEGLKCVPGRLEPVECGQDFFVFIDYAHTEDGLDNVLKALRAVSKTKIIVVFGCGGDRDRGKRPKMGKVACELADYAIITSDNPRSEAPQAIINDVTVGFTKTNFEICVDRREAIGRALKKAGKGNIVLLAGKGHEDYQVLKDKTIPFDERAIVKEFLNVYH